MKKRAKRFLTGKWTPQDRGNAPIKKKANKTKDTYNIKLNKELNTQTDWDLIRMDMKDQGISLNADSKSIHSINVTCK